MTSEQIIPSLQALGLMPEPLEDIGLKFEFEGLDYFIPLDPDDDQCLSVIIPNIHEFDDESRDEAVNAILTTLSDVKFVQPTIVYDNHVWLQYQHYLGDAEAEPAILEHIIKALAYTAAKFHSIIDNDNDD